MVVRGRSAILLPCSLLLSLVLLLTACGGEQALPSPTPSPLPPTSTPIPSPTPTPTPLPPIPLTVDWPAMVSAREDVSVRVELPGIAERDPDTLVWAWIMDSFYRLQWMGDLEPIGGGVYVAPTPLHVPMGIRAGDWQLTVSIISWASVTGERTVHFRAVPVPLQELGDPMRESISLSIPLAFAIARAEGDGVAGGPNLDRGRGGGGGMVGAGADGAAPAGHRPDDGRGDPSHRWVGGDSRG